MSKSVTNITDPKEVEKAIKKDIKKFNLADAEISKLVEKYKPLLSKKISLEDTDGIKELKSALSDIRPKRTGIEKVRKALKADIIVYGKGIDKEAKRLTDLILEIETPLKAKKEALDAEIEAEKQKQIEAENKKLGDRINTIVEKGMTLIDGFYRIGENIAVGVNDLRTMTDEMFASLLVSISAEAEKIEAEKQKEIEAEKARKAQEKKEREEFEQKKREQEAQEKKLKEEREALEAEKKAIAKQKRDARSKELENMGFVFKPVENEWVFDCEMTESDILRVENSDLDNCETEVWNKKCEDLKPKVDFILNKKQLQINNSLEESRIKREAKEAKDAQDKKEADEKAEIERKEKLDDLGRSAEYLRPIKTLVEDAPVPQFKNQDSLTKLAVACEAISEILKPFFNEAE